MNSGGYNHVNYTQNTELNTLKVPNFMACELYLNNVKKKRTETL